MGQKTESPKVLRYFSVGNFDNKKSTKDESGKIIFRDIDLFKAGTYFGRKFTNKDIDKMVDNFHELQASGTFVRVPFRIDHPGFMSGGSVKNKIGHILNLRREGSRLMSDVEIVDNDALAGIQSGKYIDRSLELGDYEDNKGTMFEMTVIGAAFVDIPKVEGLKAKFAFSKDGGEKEADIEDLNLEEMKKEKEISMKKEEDKKGKKSDEPAAKKTFEAGEDGVDDPKDQDDDKGDDGDNGEDGEDGKGSDDDDSDSDNDNDEPAKNGDGAQGDDADSKSGDDSPDKVEARKAISEKIEWRAKAILAVFKASGKTVPAMEEAELAFLKSLGDKQIDVYQKLKEATPSIIELNKEKGEQTSEKPEDKKDILSNTGDSKDSDEKAKDFFERTGGLHDTGFSKDTPKS